MVLLEQGSVSAAWLFSVIHIVVEKVNRAHQRHQDHQQSTVHAHQQSSAVSSSAQRESGSRIAIARSYGVYSDCSALPLPYGSACAMQTKRLPSMAEAEPSSLNLWQAWFNLLHYSIYILV